MFSKLADLLADSLLLSSSSSRPPEWRSWMTFIDTHGAAHEEELHHRVVVERRGAAANTEPIDIEPQRYMEEEDEEEKARGGFP